MATETTALHGSTHTTHVQESPSYGQPQQCSQRQGAEGTGINPLAVEKQKLTLDMLKEALCLAPGLRTPFCALTGNPANLFIPSTV